MIDSKTFEVKFTEDNPNKKYTGRSVGQPFRNPYSSRAFSSVVTSMYAGCDLAQEPVVQGSTNIAAFQ